MMHGFARSLLGIVVLLGANLAAAQSPSDRSGSSNMARPSTLGTGSCSGTLGAEPGCPHPQSGTSAGPASDTKAGSDDRIGSQTPSTDRMGPNAVARGGAGTGRSSSGGSGADGLGGGESGR